MSKEMREQINKIKNFGQFLNENKIFNHNYKELLDNILNSGIDKEYAKEDLDYRIKHLNDIKKNNTIQLSRLVFSKDKSSINLDNLGNHYVENISDFHEEMFDYLYMNAKKTNPSLEISDSWVVTIETDVNNIDFKETILTYSLHPFESEITILNDKNFRLISIDSYYE